MKLFFLVLALLVAACDSPKNSSSEKILLGADTTNNTGLLTIDSLSKDSGPVGAEISIFGSGFDAENNIVNFGKEDSLLGIIPHLQSSDGKSITFIVPNFWRPACSYSEPFCPFAQILIEPGTYFVSITNSNGTSNSVSFLVEALK